MAASSSLDGLMSILGAAQTTRAVSSAKSSSGQNDSGIGSDETTLSSAGNAVLMSATDTDVRVSKVANIQAAVSSGTYTVSAPIVASKVVESMLDGNS